MTRSRRPFPDLPSPLPPDLNFVLSLSPAAMTLGLANIRALLDHLGHPERAFRSALIAGTNGKGSVTTLLASILSAHGVKTGRYISPHVFNVNERIAVDGGFVTLDEMEAAARRLTPLYPEIPFSYFEALTAMAFMIFAERGVEVAVLEVGLGGRFDATNIVEPEVSVITSISMDHRRLLGDTEEAILLEKLGVSRPGTPLLVGDLKPELRAVVDERARRANFPVFGPADLGTARIVAEQMDGVDVEIVTARAHHGRARVHFGGQHQALNALLAVGAAERLLPELPHAAAGLEAAYIAGRFECIPDAGRTVVIDVGHNEAALIATASHLARFCPREDCVLVFGLLKRKELFEAPRHLLAAAGTLCLIEPDTEPDGNDPAFTPPELLANHFAPLLPNAATNVMLWTRTDAAGDPLAHLLRWLDGPGRRYRVVLATGSHRVVEEFGRRFFAARHSGSGC